MRIVHLADFHLQGSQNPGKLINGVNPQANLIQAVAAIRKQSPQPDLIVLGGDLLDNGERDSYQLVAEAFKDLQAPVHFVLGNHDSLAGFRKTAQPPRAPDFPGYFSFDLKGVHIVILYTGVAGKEFGRLDERQLLWFSEDLHQHSAQQVLIFLHHPPFDTGVGWLDKVKLANAESFWEIVPPFAQNILGVFAAHLHLQYSCVRRGVLACSCPAVSWQFSGNADAARAALSEEPPGFNLIDLHNRHISVRTVRFAAAKAVEAAKTGPAASPQHQSQG